VLERGDSGRASDYDAEARNVRAALDGYWMPDSGYYRSRVLAGGTRSTKELDIAVILAAIHTEDHGTAYSQGTAHTCQDSRVLATLERLDALFDIEYPINHNRPSGRGPALGRYAGDVYYSGGAYYFSTFAAAECCFRAAAGSSPRKALIQRGDAYLQTVRAFTPPSGDLSEQFDKQTGAQTSAKHLAWSHAAFISCIAARRAALG
jgi:glucoamylase